MSDQSTSDQSTIAKPSGFRWVVFSLACGTSWMLYFHRYVFAIIKPTLVEEYGLDNTQLGFLDSAFSGFYIGLQVPLGLAADFLGVQLILPLLGIVGSIGLALHAWAPSAYELWYARALLGAGQSAVFACLSRVTRTWFPVKQRTIIQGWVGVFFGRIGGVSCNLIVAGLLLGVFEMAWRDVVFGMAILGGFQAILFYTLFRNSPAQHSSVNAAEVALIEGHNTDDESDSPKDEPQTTSIRQIFLQSNARSRINLVMLNLQTILSTVADNVFSAWIPLWLVTEHGLKFKEMGIYSALPLLGGAIGGALGGWLNDVMIRRTGNRRWSRSLVGFIGKGTAGLLLLVALLFYDSPRLFCSMLFFVKLFSDSSLTTTWGVVTDIGGQKSATVFAYNNTVAGIGTILAPIMYGFVSEESGWIAVFVIATVTYLACACTWLLINCTIPIVAEDDPSDDDDNDF